ASVALAALRAVASAPHFTSDDFPITRRYAANIAAGRGFAYHPGASALGITTPLYTLLLALAAWMGLPPVLFGKAINIAAEGALCLVMYRWVRAAGETRRAAGYIAALWIALNPLHLRWSISGMETSLVTLAGACAWLAY